MKYFLGIDPGGTTGLALVSVNDKKPTLVEVMASKDLTTKEYQWLLKKADLLIIENFRLRPKNARDGSFDWSDMETPKIIGAIEMWAQLNDKVLVKQEPSIKPMGYGYCHMKYVKGKKGLHIQDAAAHAMFYLVTNNLSLPSKLL